MGPGWPWAQATSTFENIFLTIAQQWQSQRVVNTKLLYPRRSETSQWPWRLRSPASAPHCRCHQLAAADCRWTWTRCGKHREPQRRPRSSCSPVTSQLVISQLAYILQFYPPYRLPICDLCSNSQALRLTVSHLKVKPHHSRFQPFPPPWDLPPCRTGPVRRLQRFRATRARHPGYRDASAPNAAPGDSGFWILHGKNAATVDGINPAPVGNC